MKLVERLAGNTFYLFANWLSVTVLSFVFWIVVWKSLPPEAAGIISTSVNMIILISTFGMLGFNATLTKLISEYSKKKQDGKITALIGFSNKLLVTVNVITSVAFFSLVYYFQIDLNMPIEALAAISVGIVVWPLVHSTTSILVGLQNMRRIYTTDFAINIFKLIAAAILVYAGFGFMGPLAAIVMSFGIVVVLRRDALRLGRAVREKVDRHAVFFKYAAPAFVASVSWALFTNTPTIILTLFDSLKTTGLFAAALSITSPLALIPGIISQAVFPITSGLSGSRNQSAAQAKIIKLVMRYVFFVSVPIMIIYAFYSKALVLVFTQIHYLDAVQMIPIVGLAVLVQSIGQILVSSLFAIGKARWNMAVYLVTAAFFICTSIPMTMLLGADGLIASFVAGVAVFATASYLALRKNLKFSMPWVSMAKLAVPSLLLFFILQSSFALGLKALETLPMLALGLVLYIFILGKLKFYSTDDVAILRFAESRLKFLSPQLSALRKFVDVNRGPG
ncbi:MAG: polysaccharide biosynthesis protein [Candidatus Aenigmarchaeota archaeon]|nr:polysaccharide biosynthesis protein [Candidatus Aenigmarchaeota archaeon]